MDTIKQALLSYMRSHKLTAATIVSVVCYTVYTCITAGTTDWKAIGYAVLVALAGYGRSPLDKGSANTTGTPVE